MRRWTMLTLAVALTGGLAAVGCGNEAARESSQAEDQAAAYQPPAPPVPFQLTARQEKGRVIFESVCWTCHGKGGQGNGPTVQADSVPPPPNYQTSGIAHLTVDQLLSRFSGAFEGTDQDHPHMAYVFSVVKPEAFEDALTYIPALVYPTEIPGSAIAGQAEYQRLCQACHGPKGEGDGPASDVLLVPPANFNVDTLLAAQDWNAAFQRVKQGRGVHGSSMPAWGRVVDDATIWNLVAYIATFRPEYLSEPPDEERGGS